VAQLNLHPCAVRMSWISDEPRTGSEWGSALSNFLSDLGQHCITEGGALIGHIKGIATVAGTLCLRLSLVSLSQPVSVEGSVPDNTAELDITLNVLVFGMSANALTTALGVARDRTLACWSGSIEAKVLPALTDYPFAVHGGDD